MKLQVFEAKVKFISQSINDNFSNKNFLYQVHIVVPEFWHGLPSKLWIQNSSPRFTLFSSENAQTVNQIAEYIRLQINTKEKYNALPRDEYIEVQSL